jgi:hypothetical protein
MDAFSGYDYELVYKPHEARIHETLFDNLSRPFSQATDRQRKRNDQTMSGTFADVKIPWNHFGKKQRLYFSRNEMERADLYDLLKRRVHEIQPAFQGVLAYNDHSGRQVLIESDASVRHAIQSMGSRLKFHTTVAPDKGYLAAADLARGPSRSQSVPPVRSRFTPVGEDRSPSSLDSNYNYRSYDRQAQIQTPGSNSGRQLNTLAAGTPLPPGYSYQYASYGQPLLYGMPPHNMLLSHFLTAGHMPFYKGSWIGPSKYLYNWGPHWGHHKYHKSGWGPVW